MNTQPLVAPHEPYTLQQAFNVAWHWAHTHPRCAEDGICLYRSADNKNACLIGACIPDDRVRQIRMGEGNVPINILMYAQPGLEDVFLYRCEDIAIEEARIHAFSQLQMCHDRALDTPEVHVRLRSFARDYNLTIPETQ